MAYGLIKVDATPDSMSSMQMFIKGTGQNFRKIEDSLTGGATADVAVAKVGGGTRTLHFTSGLYTGYTDS